MAGSGAETTTPERVWPGEPYPLGASFDGMGTRFAVVSSVADAVSALVNLGYGQPQAAAAIAAAARHAGDGADTATLIRQGLKELAKA